ncbi:BnaCnng21450D [Brassica napus]|uniref:BnaCnng21450D protein n=2 Tax=Brassica napus TaxID=3708 RepID=A0A078IPT7_BRANA|nr:uncharacterized protein LOC106385058 [Brassica napus]CDY51961.1 BnaCnng21450D [Brassica napus]
MILQLPPSFQAQWKSPLACELLQEARDFTAEDNRRKGVWHSRRKKAAAMEERKRMKVVKNKEKAIDDSEERDELKLEVQDLLSDHFRLLCLQLGKLEDHQPPSLLQMELQNVDIFSVVDRCTGGGDGERSAGEEGARSMIIE